MTQKCQRHDINEKEAEVYLEIRMRTPNLVVSAELIYDVVPGKAYGLDFIR